MSSDTSDTDYEIDFNPSNRSPSNRPTNPVARTLHMQSNQQSNQGVLHRPTAMRPERRNDSPRRLALPIISPRPLVYTSQMHDLHRPTANYPDGYQNRSIYFNSRSRSPSPSPYSSFVRNELRSQTYLDRLKSYNQTVPIYRPTRRNWSNRKM